MDDMRPQTRWMAAHSGLWVDSSILTMTSARGSDTMSPGQSRWVQGWFCMCRIRGVLLAALVVVGTAQP